MCTRDSGSVRFTQLFAGTFGTENDIQEQKRFQEETGTLRKKGYSKWVFIG